VADVVFIFTLVVIFTALSNFSTGGWFAIAVIGIGEGRGHGIGVADG